ncbi:MAG: RNA-binding S4 domain-containing protein [Acidobacteriota bacterium]
MDKWLKVARIFRTRSRAREACVRGRVRVNQAPAKPHRLLDIDDLVELRQGEWRRVFRVKGLRDKPVPKAEASLLYKDLSPPRPKADPVAEILGLPVARREKGKGRPTKKERRQLKRLSHEGL